VANEANLLVDHAGGMPDLVSASQKEVAQAPTIKVTTRLVQISVVVQNKKGEPLK
jgi:hypothetical protein